MRAHDIVNNIICIHRIPEVPRRYLYNILILSYTLYYIRPTDTFNDQLYVLLCSSDVYYIL